MALLQVHKNLAIPQCNPTRHEAESKVMNRKFIKYTVRRQKIGREGKELEETPGMKQKGNE